MAQQNHLILDAGRKTRTFLQAWHDIKTHRHELDMLAMLEVDANGAPVNLTDQDLIDAGRPDITAQEFVDAMNAIATFDSQFGGTDHAKALYNVKEQ